MAPTRARPPTRSAPSLQQNESYGAAIADADSALSLDPSFFKALYRRGSASMALGRLKAARVDFRAVAVQKPADRDARAKLDECERLIKRRAFEEAIATEEAAPAWARLGPAADALVVEAAYAGPTLPALPGGSAAVGPPAAPRVPPRELMAQPDLANEWGISLRFVQELTACLRAQKRLHRKYAQQLIVRVQRLLRSYRSLIHVPAPGEDGESGGSEVRFNVCGDTHGQFYDTLNIFELNGCPAPHNGYLFNGDFVDRGSFSVENVLLLFAWKLLLPAHVHLTRGNHETRNMNKMYGFEGEVKVRQVAAAEFENACGYTARRGCASDGSFFFSHLPSRSPVLTPPSHPTPPTPAPQRAGKVRRQHHGALLRNLSDAATGCRHWRQGAGRAWRPLHARWRNAGGHCARGPLS